MADNSELNRLKEDIQKWKEEGYKVSDLERLVEFTIKSPSEIIPYRKFFFINYIIGIVAIMAPLFSYYYGTMTTGEIYNLSANRLIILFFNNVVGLFLIIGTIRLRIDRTMGLVLIYSGVAIGFLATVSFLEYPTILFLFILYIIALLLPILDYYLKYLANYYMKKIEDNR